SEASSTRRAAITWKRCRIALWTCLRGSVWPPSPYGPGTLTRPWPGVRRSSSLRPIQQLMPTASAEPGIALPPERAAPTATQRPAAISWSGLVWTLIRTDFKVRYHGTWGGFIWALAKPLTMFVSLMAVFSFLFASDPTYKLNLIIGLFLWDFFAQ